MLRIVSKCVAALQQFSPPLYEIVLDQAVDVTEWEQVLELGFGTPGLEAAQEGVTFGTLLACVTMCIRYTHIKCLQIWFAFFIVVLKMEKIMLII